MSIATISFVVLQMMIKWELLLVNNHITNVKYI